MKSVQLLFACVLLCCTAFAQPTAEQRSWNQSVQPFRIIGNVYYVGANEITSFLITSPQGHILLDGGFAETAPQIRDNIRKLGFKVEDVKYLLNSQAHFDHAAGLAALKQWTGAKFVASREDGDLVARGGHNDFAWGDKMTFAPLKPDRIIADGEQVQAGNATVTAHLTPGHTKGCTTWTTIAEEQGKKYNVVFSCSLSVPGYQLVNNPSYPKIVEDYRKSFQTFASLPCDVLLGAHGSFFHLDEKRAALAKQPATNPFISPTECRDYVKNARDAFEKQLQEQQNKTGK